MAPQAKICHFYGAKWGFLMAKMSAAGEHFGVPEAET